MCSPGAGLSSSAKPNPFKSCGSYQPRGSQYTGTLADPSIQHFDLTPTESPCKAHEDHFAVHRLRMNQPLTPQDLRELELILGEAGVGSSVDLAEASAEAHGLGLFVRSLVGLDREAAKAAFNGFISSRKLGANQLEFINLIVDQLTQLGVSMAPFHFKVPQLGRKAW